MLKKSPSKHSLSGSPKSKKSSSKDRERKKILNLGEPSSSSNSCSSVEKMTLQSTSDDEKKYLGFDAETIQCIADQFTSEKLSDEVCLSLAEDISHKIREILQSSIINMRQAKRKHLKLEDINLTFKKYNVERIYGPSDPNWISIEGPDEISFIPEEEIDLLELATSELNVTEPGDIGIDYKWLNDTSLFNNILINNSLNNYSQKMMQAAVSNKKSLRMLALKDISKNVNIGPIIPHLCNFCFMILKKNITYSSLSTPTLQFLEAIMFNPCTSYSVEENQMTLLIYLLLENIMNASNDQFFNVVAICRTLGRLCMNLNRGNQIVIAKINKYLVPELPHKRLSAPIICALTYIGNEPLNLLLWPHIEAMFRCIAFLDGKEKNQIEAAILSATSLMYKQSEWDMKVNKCLCDEFGDRLLPFWPWKLEITDCNNPIEGLSNGCEQSNWINIKMAFLKTLKLHSEQQVSHRTSQYKTVFKKLKSIINKNRIINIFVPGFKTQPIKRKKYSDENNYYLQGNLSNSVNIITGRRTLFALKRNFCVDKPVLHTNVQDLLYLI